MRQVLMPLYILTYLVLVVFDISQAHATITVDASLSHLSFTKDRAARLTITVTGARDVLGIEIPQIKGVRLHNRGQSNKIKIVNNNISSSFVHNYLVQVDKPGKYTIPPIKVTVENTVYSTKPINFKVTKEGQQGAEQTSADIVFLQLSKTGSHYPGEIVPVTIKAYFSQGYRADIRSLPTLSGDGVVMPQLGNKPQQTKEQIGDKMYNVLIWDTTLTGIKVGKHPIILNLEASLFIPRQRRSQTIFGGSNPFGDAFFDNAFGGNYQRKPISVTSAKILFTVLPLPTNDRPENFTGAIGDFTLKVAVDPTDVEVGEPITLTMDISGKGNFDRVEAPIFPENSRWKTYSPNSTFSAQKNSYSGVKSFEQAIVAKNSTVTEIPSLVFSYFDPLKKTYITRTSKAIAVKLNRTASIQTTQANKSILKPQQRHRSKTNSSSEPLGIGGLAPIHLELGTLHETIDPLYKKTWFIATLGTCILILLAIILFAIRHRAIKKYPEIQSRRHKKLLLSRDLTKLAQAKKDGDTQTFLALSRTTIQNHLGVLWDMQAAAISLTDIKRRLPAEAQLIEIFAAAEAAAYCGAILSQEKMHDYFMILRTKLEDIL